MTDTYDALQAAFKRTAPVGDEPLVAYGIDFDDAYKFACELIETVYAITPDSEEGLALGCVMWALATGIEYERGQRKDPAG